MPTRSQAVRTGLRFAAAFLVLAGALGWAGATRAGGTAYDVAPRTISFLPPGTVVDKGPPEGWTNLVIKINPHPGAGDVSSLSDHLVKLSSSFFIAVVANVEGVKGPDGATFYRLKGVASGCGMAINGKDTVITSDTQRKLGANLDFLGRSLLSGNEERVQRVRVVISSDTLAVIDVPGHWYKDRQHVPIVRRYALLLDQQTGRLESLVWRLERDDRNRWAAAGPMEWLAPNTQEDCVLHVDANLFRFTIPTEESFAVMRMPKGQAQVAIADDLKAVAAETRPTSAVAADLHAKLAAAMSKATAAPPPP